MQVTDLCVRSLFAFFIVEHASRRVIHSGVTRHPPDAWVAQQMREATPFGEHPRFLLRENNSPYGAAFAHVAAISGAAILTTPYRMPRAIALGERFLGCVRRTGLDHVLILGEAHLQRAPGEYVTYVNRACTHHGIAQRVPQPWAVSAPTVRGAAETTRVPVLGGLHHDYRRAT